MPTKKNSAGEQQEYDESTGWYVESKTQWITSKRDFFNVQADKNNLQYDSENGKIKQNKGFINIQLFGRIKDQTPRQLKKTIRSLDKRIQEHKEKIENPKLAYKEEWDTFNDARKNRSLQHWEQEIKAFTQQREDAIKFLGDDKNDE